MDVSASDAQLAWHHTPGEPSAWEKLNHHGWYSLTAQQLGPHFRLGLTLIAGDGDLLN